MPVSSYFGGRGTEVLKKMMGHYGKEKGKKVFYATAMKMNEDYSNEMGMMEGKKKKKKRKYA